MDIKQRKFIVTGVVLIITLLSVVKKIETSANCRLVVKSSGLSSIQLKISQSDLDNLTSKYFKCQDHKLAVLYYLNGNKKEVINNIEIRLSEKIEYINIIQTKKLEFNKTGDFADWEYYFDNNNLLINIDVTHLNKNSYELAQLLQYILLYFSPNYSDKYTPSYLQENLNGDISPAEVGIEFI